jgi:hypothetical protein
MKAVQVPAPNAAQDVTPTSMATAAAAKNTRQRPLAMSTSGNSIPRCGL